MTEKENPRGLEPIEPDDAEMAAALVSDVPGTPSPEIPQETRAALRELGVADYLPGRRCVTEAMRVMAAYPDVFELDPERVYPIVARRLGLSETQIAGQVEAVIASMGKNCPPEVLKSRFPEGIPDQKRFLERVFEKLYRRLGRQIWGQ